MTPIVVVLVAGIVGVIYLTIQASQNLRQPVDERPIEDIQPNIYEKKNRMDRLQIQMNEKDPDFFTNTMDYNETDISNFTDSSISVRNLPNFRTLFHKNFRHSIERLST